VAGFFGLASLKFQFQTGIYPRQMTKDEKVFILFVILRKIKPVLRGNS